MIDRRTLIAAAITAPVATAPVAAAPAAAFIPAPAIPLADAATLWPPREHLALWPGTAPGTPARLPTYAPTTQGGSGAPELRLRGIATPLVGVYRPERPDGRAVLVIPGGGYGFVAIENEGLGSARALNPAGITVFVLAYRLPGEGWCNRADVPLQDAQRAMRLIRAAAARFGIAPAMLGVLGFSAGGHLAAALTVGHADRVYAPVDAADAQSARPAHAGLIYPVTSLATPSTHRGSSDALLGPAPAAATIARYDTPRRLTAATPPLFVVHSMDDTTVPVEQSLDLITAARTAKVTVEAHLFERGGHGYGPLKAPADAPHHLWPSLYDRWQHQR